MIEGGGWATIVIPARHGSVRLPGKPLIPIAGRSLLSRVVDIARRAAALSGRTDVLVATDDDRIADHAAALNVPVALTRSDITTGSGRVLAAMADRDASIIVNLQGDAPFVAPEMVAALIAAMRSESPPVTTGATRLSWTALDDLRAQKLLSPSSGTTCIVSPGGIAIWFSKAIIPFIRDEAALRAATPTSPVFRHVGMYAYTPDALRRFEAAPPSPYERLEGLEQLRFLDIGLPIRIVEMPAPAASMSGIDTLDDVRLAEALIAAHGDPFGG